MRDLADRNSHLNNRITNLEAIIKAQMGLKDVSYPIKDNNEQFSEASLKQVDESNIEET